MHYVNVVLDWIEAHPTIFALVILPILGAVVSWLGKPRSPEEFERMPYVLAQLLRIWSAVFPDPNKLVKVIGEMLAQRAAEKKTTPKLPPDPPSGAGGLGVLALAMAVSMGMQACGVTPAQHAANVAESVQAAAEYEGCREAAKDGGTFASFCECVRTVDAKHRIDGGACE